eukprot:c20805_g1_i1.p2 GENE.c20805_g1_i1~~c20805_g1_i1.p2  ORF type:complete len:119 (+),score=28.62 c20805_g1_i1:53-409(+)
MGITRTNQRKQRRSNLKTLDQVYPEVQPDQIQKNTGPRPIVEDLPGLGQFYCITCSRYFVDSDTLAKHSTSKFHKKRLRQLKEVPYSHAEAMRAGGSGGIDNGPKLNRAPNAPQPISE